MIFDLSSNDLTTGNSSDFKIQLDRPIFLNEQRKYECALLSATIPYTWFNVTTALGNNTIAFSDNSGSSYSILTIPDGIYSFANLNSLFSQYQLQEGLDLGTGIAQIQLVVNFNTGHVGFEFGTATHFCDLAGSGSSTFGLLCGFSQTQIDSPLEVDTQGENIADINNGIDRIRINTNLLIGTNSSIVGSQFSNVLYSFTPDQGPFNLLEIAPLKIQYIETPIREIRELHVYLTDNNNNPVDLADQITTYRIELREQKRN